MYPYSPTTSTSTGIRISELRRHPTSPIAADLTYSGNGENILYESLSPGGSGHFGGRLEFGPDGMLYAFIGDGAGQNNTTGAEQAQDLSLPFGKILRMDVDGASLDPGDNPFGHDNTNPPASPLVWSYGLRNPYGSDFDRSTNRLFVADVSEVTWEELNALTVDQAVAANFGWPCYEGPLDRTALHPTLACPDAMVEAVIVEPRTGGSFIVGGETYRGGEVLSLGGTFLYAVHECAGNFRLRIMAFNPRLETTTDITQDLFGTNCNTLSMFTYVYGFGADLNGELYIVGLGVAVGRTTIARIDPQGPAPFGVACMSQPPSSTGPNPRLYAEGSSSLAASDLSFYGWDVAPSAVITLWSGLVSTMAPTQPPNGVVCIGQPRSVAASATSTPGGAMTFDVDLGPSGLNALAGQQILFQAFFRDTVNGQMISGWTNRVDVLVGP